MAVCALRFQLMSGIACTTCGSVVYPHICWGGCWGGRVVTEPVTTFRITLTPSTDPPTTKGEHDG